ncbi:hypothetical protein V7152_23505 [Neobacillus drentensis]|uniref:hypothetical protein n=1 Tax=Neobacillus drentensis TaxID=220684 RepID=UPI002FFDEBB2
MNLTDKEKARIGELIDQALDHDKPALSEDDVKELESLLKKLEAANKKKDSKEQLSERIVNKMTLALGKQALEFNSKKAFNQLSPKEKAKRLGEKLDKIERSQYFKEIQAKNKEQEERAALEAYWKEHEKKYGSKL